MVRHLVRHRFRSPMKLAQLTGLLFVLAIIAQSVLAVDSQRSGMGVVPQTKAGLGLLELYNHAQTDAQTELAEMLNVDHRPIRVQIGRLAKLERTFEMRLQRAEAEEDSNGRRRVQGIRHRNARFVVEGVSFLGQTAILPPFTLRRMAERQLQPLFHGVEVALGIEASEEAHLMSRHIDTFSRSENQLFIVTLETAGLGLLLLLLAGANVLAYRRRIDEEKRALRQSEERYRLLVERSPLPIAVHDGQRVLYINPAGMHMLHAHGPDELIGKLITEIVHPDFHELAAARVTMTVTQGVGGEPIHERMICVDGEVIDVELTTMSVEFEGRQAVQVVARDITEQKAAHEALQRETERRSTIIEIQQQVSQAGLDPISVMASIVRWSSQLVKADGAAVALVAGNELILREATGVLAPHDGLRVPLEASLSGLCARTGEIQIANNVREDQRVFVPGRPNEFQTLIVIPLRREEHVVGNLHVAWAAPGAAIQADIDALQMMAGVCSVALQHAAEYTEKQALLADRTAALEALRESEERYSAVAETATDVIVTSDEAGKIMSVNLAVERVFGYKRESLIGQQVTVLTARRMRPRYRALYLRSLCRHRSSFSWSAMELVGQHSDGREIPLEASFSIFYQGGQRMIAAVIRDVTQRKRVEAELAHQALHDSLTGLPNRMLLRDRLQQAILMAEREQEPASLCFMDLNRFKEVNDTFGHHSGDALLEHLAERLKQTLRSCDTVARLGGDEFAILLPDVDGDHAKEISERILQSLDAPFFIGDQVFDVGASIGISVFPDHGIDAGTLMRRADIAMYVAKRSGRGCIVYSPEYEAGDPDRIVLTRELRHAIEHDELILHYQPLVHLGTGRVERVEALVRWNHPERGTVSPGMFIPLAEEKGMVTALTAWVLDEALRQAALWSRQGLDLGVAVNLSARSLHDPALVDMITRSLQTWNTPPRLLEMEITESAIIVDPPRALETLEVLHNMGISIAIDDFGTGYSSLAYLKRLPVDEIKIDRSFVTDMLHHADNAVIVRSLVELGRNLDLKVVAEGVEDGRTLEALHNLGCDLAQGYHLSAPLPAQNLRKWLMARAVAMATE